MSTSLALKLKTGEIAAGFPPKLAPLFEPARYKVLWGGRDAGRSWGAARGLLTLGYDKPLRILCAREIQKTLADSVLALLKDQIVLLGLDGFYRADETSVSGRNGTEFIFAGLRDLDANKVKSYEGVDIAWVEEAETLSKRSFNILDPTIRKDDSEIWFTFNPQLDSDFIYQHFVVTGAPGAVVIQMNWQDNPWASRVLAPGREHMRLTDYAEYENIWLGKVRTVVAGAIYAKEVMAMIESRRARPMPYDPQLPVHTIWDLGWNDNMSIIMAQRQQSAVMVIDYLEDQFKTYADCVKELNKRPYVWGTDWLPHDGTQTHPESGKNAKQVLEGLKRKSVKIMPRLDVESGIKAARMMFPRLYIDNNSWDNPDWKFAGGERLVECLKRYKRSVPLSTGEPGGPVHDEFSHGSDALRGLATIVDKMTNEDEDSRPRFQSYGVLDRVVGM